MMKDGQVIGQMNRGRVFGELAILYDCMRTASVRGTTFLLFLWNFFISVQVIGLHTL